MYEKAENKINKIKIFAGVMSFVVVVGFVVAGYFLWVRPDQEPETAQNNLNTAPLNGGVFATFNQSSKSFESGQQSTNQEPETKAAATYSNQPYGLDLPAGWSEADTKTEKSPCGGEDEWTTKTFVNEQETLIVYEDGNPGGCEKSAVADTYLDFDFTQDNSGLTINSNTVVQCNKDDNPACPKGDGKVSIFIANENPDNPKKFLKNKITNKSYYFSIVDTKIDSDFTTQVKELSSLVELIKFK